MSGLKHTILAIFFSLACSNALASKEGSLNFNSFSVTSEGIGESGEITVSGKQTEEGITKLTIIAFGKTIIVPADKLVGLSNIGANQIHISYDTAKIIYLRLTHGTVRGGMSGKIIEIKSSGKISIREISKNE